MRRLDGKQTILLFTAHLVPAAHPNIYTLPDPFIITGYTESTYFRCGGVDMLSRRIKTA